MTRGESDETECSVSFAGTRDRTVWSGEVWKDLRLPELCSVTTIHREEI